MRLGADDRIEVVAPLGLDDLLGLVFKPTESGRRRIALYRARLAGKPWQRRWPQARFVI